MRLALGMLTLFAALIVIDGGTGSAQAGAWCARYFGKGGTNCGFYTIEQCRATVSGIGGFCEQNVAEPPLYYYDEPRRYRRYRR